MPITESHKRSQSRVFIANVVTGGSKKRWGGKANTYWLAPGEDMMLGFTGPALLTLLKLRHQCLVQRTDCSYVLSILLHTDMA